MVNRPYCTVLLLLLLLLHTLTVHSFTSDNAVTTSRGLNTSSMMYSSKLGRQIVHPLHQHATTHQRNTSSLLCRQSQRCNQMMMSRRDCRHYFADRNNYHRKSTVRIWPSNRSHQLRRWQVSLKSHDIEDTNSSSSIQNHSNDPYAVAGSSSNDDSSKSTTHAHNNNEGQLTETNNGGKATHWFTYSLPEGYCVGVLDSASLTTNGESVSSSSAVAEETICIEELLHPEEYKWGQTNMSNISSRTSYYLGRVALRLALKRLLLHDKDNNRDSEEPSTSTTAVLHQKQRLYNTIANNPIQKDSHGRPILPEMVVGSISHKGGECAVGLARFHPLFYDLVDGRSGSSADESVMTVDEEVQWREDCPIYYDEEEEDDDSSSNVSNRERIGIGVDIEYIDGIRGERIKRRVLTKNEQNELGGLSEEGISIGEEVMLRFSLKEAVYKAMHPILCEFVGFQEAEIKPLSDGTATVILNLQSGSHERLGIVVKSVTWRKLEGGKFFLTTALVGVDSSSSS